MLINFKNIIIKKLKVIGLIFLCIFTITIVTISKHRENLSKNQFRIASKTIRYLKNNKRSIRKKLSNFNSANIKRNLKNFGVTKIDYIELFNSKTLTRPRSNRENFKIFIAFYLNKTRLIDNI